MGVDIIADHIAPANRILTLGARSAHKDIQTRKLLRIYNRIRRF
jgi:hypothetical protein